MSAFGCGLNRSTQQVATIQAADRLHRRSTVDGEGDVQYQVPLSREINCLASRISENYWTPACTFS